MQHFLAKSEPDVYSIDHFQKDVKTIWDGIKNPQALRTVRSMQPGDRVFIYHSGGEPAVVGLGQVTSPPAADPKDPKLAVVELKYLRHLTPPTTLREIKQSGLFGDWVLVRQGRLSTMAAPPEFVDWMRDRYPGTDI